jgi:membrane associated rhomboid family serine protease
MSQRHSYRQYRFQSPGGFGPPMTPALKALLIANAVVFFVQNMADRSFPFSGLFAVTPSLVLERQMIWQPFTYMWLHGSFMHLASNLFSLWMFGGALESLWGSRRFLIHYLLCGFGAGVLILGCNALFAYDIPTLGASGAIFGVLTASSLIWPDRTIMLLFPPVPIKAIWLVPLLFALDLMSTRSATISHVGHLGGVLVAGWLLRDRLGPYLGLASLRHRYHRWRMRNRLREVRREEWQRRNDRGPRKPD